MFGIDDVPPLLVGEYVLGTNSMSNQQHQRAWSWMPGATIRGVIPAYVLVSAVSVPLSVAYGYYCFLDEAPLTKRKRLLATSPAWERRMGDDAARQLIAENKSNILPPDHRASVTVRRVGARIAAAAEKFAAENLHTEIANGAGRLNYTVIRSDMANAFVLPNNHVFVLTGMFKYARTEDELAGVIGHEMAHCLARHAGERVSGNLLMNVIARLMLMLDPTGVLYTMFLPAASLLHDLPHSRDAEIEADHIGLYLAAEACYDPRAATNIFARMKNDSSTQGQEIPPEFLSTHPSYETRLSKFDEWMPDAMAKFNADGGSKCVSVRREMKAARIRADLSFAPQKISNKER